MISIFFENLMCAIHWLQSYVVNDEDTSQEQVEYNCGDYLIGY